MPCQCAAPLLLRDLHRGYDVAEQALTKQQRAHQRKPHLRVRGAAHGNRQQQPRTLTQSGIPVG